MRDIKFRAWDGKSMIYNPLSFGQKFPMNELMQFTGLTDKKGVEIYEGDIVKILERDWPSQLDSFPELTHEQYLEKLTSTAMVVFDDGGFRLSRITTNSYYYTDYVGHTKMRDIFEVIGNIYEHPELFKET